jgi:hypothetical protein
MAEASVHLDRFVKGLRNMRNISPSLTVVGPGSDKAAPVYASIATRPNGGVGDSAADAVAVAAYLSIFTIQNEGFSLPGYGLKLLIDSLRALGYPALAASAPTAHGPLVRGDPGLAGGNPGRAGGNPRLGGGNPGLDGGNPGLSGGDPGLTGRRVVHVPPWLVPRR